MGDAEDFWPAIDNAEDPNSPVVVLRKQAEILTEKSGQRLRGGVSTQTVRLEAQARELLGIDDNTAFTHVFKITVPSLEYYSSTHSLLFRMVLIPTQLSIRTTPTSGKLSPT
jgi:hypothetical protein